MLWPELCSPPPENNYCLRGSLAGASPRRLARACCSRRSPRGRCEPGHGRLLSFIFGKRAYVRAAHARVGGAHRPHGGSAASLGHLEPTPAFPGPEEAYTKGFAPRPREGVARRWARVLEDRRVAVQGQLARLGRSFRSPSLATPGTAWSSRFIGYLSFGPNACARGFVRARRALAGRL